MDNYFFGVKCNGVSIEVTQLSISDDQSAYDYICNVSLKQTWNGNGAYDVSIVNKDYIQGMPVGDWRITKACIRYWWGDSKAILKMEDAQGNETCEIVSTKDRGSASYFDVPSMTRTIFTKAQQIVRDYPNAKVCNAIMELQESQENINVSSLRGRYQDKLKESDINFMDFIESGLKQISKHVNLYMQARELLVGLEDERSKQLLKDITTDCRHLFSDLFAEY